MEDVKPQALGPREWKEIMTVPVIRKSSGVDEDVTVEDFSSHVYAAKFDSVSGSPGYAGDLFVLQDNGSLVIFRWFFTETGPAN